MHRQTVLNAAVDLQVDIRVTSGGCVIHPQTQGARNGGLVYFIFTCFSRGVFDGCRVLGSLNRFCK